MAQSNDGGWSPYLAGALSGLVSVFSVWLAGKYLGASTTFAKSAGMLESLAAPERVSRLEYFLKNTPQIDWQWMFVAGIFLGALVGALSDRSFAWEPLPPMWRRRFGERRWPRWLAAFTGGVVAMFGARLADG
jgi:hypothetical protein